MSILTPVLIEGDASVEVTAEPATNGTILHLLVLSEKFEKVNAEVAYRRRNTAWTAISMTGPTLLGILASATGDTTDVLWRHAENHLSDGDLVELRATVSGNLFYGWSGVSSVIDCNQEVQAAPSQGKKIVGVSRDGRWMCFDSASNDFQIVDREGTLVGYLDGLTNPRWAQQKRDGRYLILHNDSITEWDRDDGIIQTVSMAAVATTAMHFDYDDLTGNLLIAGGTMDQVAEVSWGDTGAGTLIGTHSGLSNPQGVSYGENRNRWYIADTGNNRVVIVDRTAGTSTNLTQVDIDGETVAIQSPVFVKENGTGSILIVELQGVPAVFTADPETHPALSRANGSGPTACHNLIFTPLQQAI